MKSHDYTFQFRDGVRVIGSPLLLAAIMAGALHASARLRWLPPPRPTLDTDRTILIHQAEAASKPTDAEVILIGDSSCLMNVDARQLGFELGRPTLNLGTLSFLDLGDYSQILSRCVSANPGRVKWIILLMHPEALRRTGAESYYVEVLRRYWSAEDYCRQTTINDQIGCALGIEIVRGRILSRLMPIPLAGVFGSTYGFSCDLERAMEARRGSLIDPVVEKSAVTSEYRLAPTLESFSQQFREAVPPEARLAVGITPVSTTRAGPTYPEIRSRMVQTWGAWLRADGTLHSLPATLPDDQFTKPAHLNGSSVPGYTSALAVALKAAGVN